MNRHIARLVHKNKVANIDSDVELIQLSSPLSQDDDPRVKKLKKELEKLEVKPRPKYINFTLK